VGIWGGARAFSGLQKTAVKILTPSNKGRCDTTRGA
jgi:hypothetical protein